MKSYSRTIHDRMDWAIDILAIADAEIAKKSRQNNTTGNVEVAYKVDRKVPEALDPGRTEVEFFRNIIDNYGQTGCPSCITTTTTTTLQETERLLGNSDDKHSHAPNNQFLTFEQRVQLER